MSGLEGQTDLKIADLGWNGLVHPYISKDIDGRISSRSLSRISGYTRGKCDKGKYS